MKHLKILVIVFTVAIVAGMLFTSKEAHVNEEVVYHSFGGEKPEPVNHVKVLPSYNNSSDSSESIDKILTTINETLTYNNKKLQTKKTPYVELVICLDTSGSMSGLIEQAKMQLWKIVNEMATAKRGKRSPLLEVALYEYGKSSIPASQGYIKMLVPLTTDLDRISEELFKLRTNGGSEYCGMVNCRFKHEDNT